MDIIDFENYMTGLMVDEVARDHINNIYSLIDREAFSLALPLRVFHGYLITHYTENKSLIAQGYTPEQMAKSSFSQFLQHLFHYILRRESDGSYVKGRLLNILRNHPDFYYRSVIGHETKVMLWIDPSTGETALTGACRKADQEIVELLLERLKTAFNINRPQSAISPELDSYIFRENHLGHSALIITWLKNKPRNMEHLFAFAKAVYGDENTVGFRRFLFQIDSEERSALMRAIEKGKQILVSSILEHTRQAYRGDRASEAMQHLFMQQDKKGETVLHKAIAKNDFIMLDTLFKRSKVIFNGVKTSGFKRFLLTSDNEGTTPLILASKQGTRSIIDLILNYGVKNDVVQLSTIHQLMSQQNNAGYTALMQSVEKGDVNNVRYLLNTLIEKNYRIIGYDIENIFRVLNLKTIQGETILQIAAKKNYWQILDILIETLNYVSLEKTRSMMLTLDVIDEDNPSLLTRLFLEEQAFRDRLTHETRVPTFLETKASKERLRLAKKFAYYGLRFSKSPSIESWQSIDVSRPLENWVSFFSIFCSSSQQRVKRTLGICSFELEKLHGSFPEDSIQQLRKEALINLMAIYTQSNLNSIEQVTFIRKQSRKSAREKTQLAQFDQEVANYYEIYGSSSLSRLKSITAKNLDAAFSLAQPILVDNGKDFIVIDKDKLFFSMLSSTELVSLDPKMDNVKLKNWLDIYFGRSYSLHPFDPEIFNDYPKVLSTLVKPIISDAELLQGYYEDIKGTTLNELFLLDGNLIADELSKLAASNFFENYGDRLSFRAENFHFKFFELALYEQYGLKKIFTKYNIVTATNPHLSENENEYLTVYGAKIIDLVKRTSTVELISPTEVFDISIDAHKHLLERENSLSVTEKRQIIASFQKLKENLTLGEAGKAHAKVILQLIVLLFPSAVRTIATKNFVELAIPLGLIASDVVLREFLMRLVKHPQVMQIFAGELAGKVLGIIEQTVERVPIVGSALALYGLIQSAKALITLDKDDPNRSYYAHLLINNLVMVGTMGTEAAVSLPYWPVLGLFAALTFDQVLAEGARIHDVELKLEDDKNHPLLKFYRKIKLGLGIVDAEIKVVQEQRELFDNFLNYLNKVQNENEPDAIVAVTLPAIRSIKIQKTPLNSVKGIGCSFSSNPQIGVYPRSSLCTRTILMADKKENYAFELGDWKIFCERRDPFYTQYTSNFTLLTGTLSPGCALGQETNLDVVAVSNGENAAGLLVNKNMRNSNITRYQLFLAVDPFHVADYVVTLKKNSREVLSENDGLNYWLSCSENTVYCINKIKVVVSDLYSIAATDQSIPTKIIIKDDELRQDGARHKGIQAIEYLIAKSDQLSIYPNNIPQQSFSFFKNEHELQFEGNFLKSENGLTVSTNEVRRLTLDFTDKAKISGTFTPNEHQEIIVNQLKGVNEAKVAILNTKQCRLFSVSLGQDTEFIDKESEITVKGNFREAILDAHRHANNNATFYQLLKPINDLNINQTNGNSLILSLKDKEEQGTINLTKKSLTNPIVFSGSYELNGKICFSKIVMMYNVDDLAWECSLIINASALNDAEDIDLKSIQGKSFNKISMIIPYLDSTKLVHYFFYPLHSFPSITGKFIDYRLKTSQDGWILILSHEQRNEETRVFLAENASEIVINNIRYLLKPAAADLFALGPEAMSAPINVENLIAPLEVQAPFCQVMFSAENKTYKLDNLTLVDTPFKGNIYFDGQVFPLDYIKYSYIMNQTKLQPPVFAAQLNSQQTVEEKEKIFKLETIVNKNWLNRINGWLLAGAVVTTMAISAGFFLVIRRFKRPQPQTSNIAPLAAIVPLLNPVEGISGNANACEKSITNVETNAFKLFDQTLLNVSTCVKTVADNNSCFSEKLTPSFYQRTELNSNLIFLDYLLRYSKRATKKMGVGKNKNKKIKTTLKSANFPFYAYSIAENTQKNATFNKSLPIQLLP